MKKPKTIFDEVCDAAIVHVPTSGDPQRRKRGRAASAMEPTSASPAPEPIPAKPGRRKAILRSETSDGTPSVASDPARKAGKGMAVCEMEPVGFSPSPSTHSDSRADVPKEPNCPSRAKKGMAVRGMEPGSSSPSPSPILRKRGRPASHKEEPTKGSPAASISDVHLECEHHLTDAIGQGLAGQSSNELQSRDAREALHRIIEGWKMRQRWHKAEKSLVLQGKAICRSFCDGDKGKASALFDAALEGFKAVQKGKNEPPKSGVELPHDVLIALDPFLPAVLKFETERKQVERSLEKDAAHLPAYHWMMSIRGVGPLSFVAIVGEASVVENDRLRTIGDYKSVAALWKRMGVAVIGGERQRRVSDRDLALVHGYNPARRSVVWNIGGGVIGGMGFGPRPLVGEDISARDDLSKYQKMFIDRCRYLCARDPEKFPLSQAKKTDKASGEEIAKESYTKHCAASAKRYVEKKLLRDLYARWRFETLGEVVNPDTAWQDRLPLAAE